MRALFDGIPLEAMNTSMTINATAAWLLALYVAAAEEQGADLGQAAGHGAERHHQGIPLAAAPTSSRPSPSLKLIADVAEYCYRAVPKWNPMNVCSYHLQEAGATPEQELAFALATARAVLDQVRGQVAGRGLPRARRPHLLLRQRRHPLRHRDVQDARLRRPLGRDHRDRYGVADPKLRRFRYGVQVNSLGLTEQQPENNVYRILIEMLAVVLSKKRPRPRRAAAGLERGARPAAPLGPAVVAPDAADHGLRDRPARIRRPLRRQPGGRAPRSRR